MKLCYWGRKLSFTDNRYKFWLQQRYGKHRDTKTQRHKGRPQINDSECGLPLCLCVFVSLCFLTLNLHPSTKSVRRKPPHRIRPRVFAPGIVSSRAVLSRGKCTQQELGIASRFERRRGLRRRIRPELVSIPLLGRRPH